MKFVEETGGQWAADKLRMAEADFEQQKREWEANRQAALRKAEEEAELQQQMDEDDYPLTYSSEDAKNQVKAKSNSRTVDQMSSTSSGVVGGSSGRSVTRTGRLSVQANVDGVRRAASSGSRGSVADSKVRSGGVGGGEINEKRGRLANTPTTPTKNARTGNISNKSTSRNVPAIAKRSAAAVVNGGGGKKPFVTPSAGKQMPRMKSSDTSTPIRKVLRGRYSSMTLSEESMDNSTRGAKSRSTSRQRLLGIENGGGHPHNSHGESGEVINCDEDSNSECSMDVMVDSNDATDSNRTGNDNDSLHSLTEDGTAAEGDGSAVNSPRTRSRGSVKINLWTLDESPLPIVRKQSRLATDSFNASSLVRTDGDSDSEEEDGDEEDEDEDKSLEEVRRRAVSEKSLLVNGGGSGASVTRKRKCDQEAEVLVEDCKRMTRRASIMGHAVAKEHNNNANGPVPVAVNSP